MVGVESQTLHAAAPYVHTITRHGKQCQDLQPCWNLCLGVHFSFGTSLGFGHLLLGFFLFAFECLMLLEGTWQRCTLKVACTEGTEPSPALISMRHT